MKHRLMLLAIAATVAWSRAPDAEARQPANVQFHAAYRTLIQADIARDEQRVGEAIELYNTAAQTYVALMREYPDWEPGATRFRIQHCQQELGRLKRLQEKGPVDMTQAGGRTPATAGSAASNPSDDLHRVKVAAVTLLDEGKAEEARQALMNGMQINPDDSGLRVLLGMAQCLAGRHHDAVFLLRNVVEEDPYNAHAHAALGTAYFGLARYADAAVEMKKAADSNPALSEPHFNLAQILSISDPPDVSGAEYHYRKALRLGGKRDADLEQRLQLTDEPEEPAAPTASDTDTPDEQTDAKPVPQILPMVDGSEKTLGDGEDPAGGEKQKKSWLRSIVPW